MNKARASRLYRAITAADIAARHQRYLNETPTPDDDPADDDPDAIFSAEWARTIDNAISAAGLAPRNRFAIMTGADMAARPQGRERIRGVLPDRGIGAVYGPSMSGKTFVTLDMLAAVAEGDEWFGHRVNPAPVVFVALEGEGGAGKRAQALNCDRVPYMLPGTFDLRSAADRAGLAQAIKAAGLAGGIVALDTWAQASPGMDENSGKDVGAAIAGLKALQAELGGLILAVAHTDLPPKFRLPRMT